MRFDKIVRATFVYLKITALFRSIYTYFSSLNESRLDITQMIVMLSLPSKRILQCSFNSNNLQLVERFFIYAFNSHETL